ncbi:MAG: transketolase C-terminal domain-containing protein [Bellilinea sp.]
MLLNLQPLWKNLTAQRKDGIYAMISLNPAKSNQQIFADTLLSLAKADPQVLVVTSDSRGSGKLNAFGKTLPAQLVEVGIAEQNLVGVAAGLSAAGKKVFAVSPACFLSARALEQIKNDVAYSDHPVKLVGISAGVSYGALGSTHHSLHDLAVLQSIHNLDIVVPADNFETQQITIKAVEHPRPLYIRLGKKAMPDLPKPLEPVEIGKLNLLRSGADVLFFATGETVAPAYSAAIYLSAQGISAGVASLHSLNPLDAQAILSLSAASRAVITVEEHSIHGGAGSRIASLLVTHRLFKPMRMVGIPYEYTVTGSQEDIFSYYGMTAEKLAATALDLLDNGKEPTR